MLVTRQNKIDGIIMKLNFLTTALRKSVSVRIFSTYHCDGDLFFPSSNVFRLYLVVNVQLFYYLG